LVLSTRYLFSRLLRPFEIATVCDVGSLDGADSLLFRRMLPTARILALEANPRNFELMKADEELRRESIHVMPFAASDRDEEAPFYVVRANYSGGRDRGRRGMSSLHKRHDESQLDKVVQVRTVRLDSLLGAEPLVDGPIALWIDTEGMALEVIRGAAGVLQSTRMLHVEVETERCIGRNQKLFVDVEKTLTEAGFILLATDRPQRQMQFNALFVRADVCRQKAGTIRWWTRAVRLRRIVTHAGARVVPAKLWRMLVALAH
jgi:FkbM family methyltransferase